MAIAFRTAADAAGAARLVRDIEAALRAAVEAGGEIAHPPMEIPGHGTFAIYIHGGVHHGLWKL